MSRIIAHCPYLMKNRSAVSWQHTKLDQSINFFSQILSWRLLVLANTLNECAQTNPRKHC